MSPRKKPTWAIDPLVTAAGAVIEHSDTRECHTVLSASREHAALAVLAALDHDLTMTTTELIEAAQEPITTSCEGYCLAVLQPLQGARLIDRERKSRWSATPAGRAMAVQLGSLGAALDHQARQLGHHEELQRATPCRPRGAMGSGDLRPPMHRPGSEDALGLPSRVGGWLVWRDEKREAVA